ncbi:Transcription factor ORG2 [Heracleum sosnowskyi]|uniref:Transcription factor ORG2 n=1 Tax=Heracleum sosnowskyi TaxID=360622 RepID=A0AAD8MBH0_9APIA|nr:Transcription factor ORG2 [Heracleum sosnowskyi]
MLTLSPPLFPSFGWPLVDDDDLNIISQDQNDTFVGNFGYMDTSISDLLPSPQSTNFEPIGSGDINTTGVVKKLNHNASERDRRKKINDLYSSLFSLLPDADRMKKLSIPATVACVVKYIPELQKEVEILIQKKEELSSRMCRQREDSTDYQVGKRRKVERNKETSLSAAVTISPVGCNEVVVQISALQGNKGLLSEALSKLELGDGLFLLNASSFQSIGDRIFHTLHFQAQGKYELELQAIKEKIMSLYEKHVQVVF